MSAPLLRTKLYVPPLRTRLVSRPRLVRRLNDGLKRKLTLISAPAGFGKTTLLSEWAAETRQPVAWVALDRGDNDPARFWAYLITALQTIHASVGALALGALQSPQAPPMETLLAGLITEVAEIPTGDEPSSRSLALVLDDYHLITESGIQDGLVFLVDHLPPQMHLILSSRADPPWSLARLRAQRDLTELRAEELRFTPEEATTYLNISMGLGLSAADITALEARTEGWIAGLQMAALAMQGVPAPQEPGHASRFIRAFSGSHRFVLDYLVEEVLDRQSPVVHEFLLRTSVLERLTSELCDAVTDRNDSQRILVQLEQANLFLVPLDDERTWYRYHHLFADLLRRRLAEMDPGQAPGLHRRASEWFEQKGLIAEAAQHALAAGDVDQVSLLVSKHAAAMIYHGELETLERWLSALPEKAVQAQPWVFIAHGWVQAYLGQFEAAEQQLANAESAFTRLCGAAGDAPPMAEAQRIAGQIAGIRGYCRYFAGDRQQAINLARQALALLPEEDLMMRGTAAALLGAMLRAEGDLAASGRILAEALTLCQATGDAPLIADTLSDLAVLQISQGKLHAAFATCRQLLQVADEYARHSGRRPPVVGQAQQLMSHVSREWNDLEAAVGHARRGVDVGRHWGKADSVAYSYFYLARALQAAGDRHGALEAIQEAQQMVRGLSHDHYVYMGAQRAQFALFWGDVPAASRWAQESGLSAGDPVSVGHGFVHLALARVLLAQREFDAAQKLLAQLREATEEAGAMPFAIQASILQALAWQAQGQREQALIALKQALAWAKAEGYVRIFVDEGAPLGELLRQAAARGIGAAPSIGQDYVARLLGALGSEARDAVPLPRRAPLLEPLSQREIEVVRLLAAGLSNKEIAQTLVIAVNTVKNHLKNIYGKLGVHSRVQAVDRARRLGLL